MVNNAFFVHAEMNFWGGDSPQAHKLTNYIDVYRKLTILQFTVRMSP
jgi:hypothetical protein